MFRSLHDARRSAARRLVWVTATLVWIAAVCVGMKEMWAYESRPGAAATPSSSAPRPEGEPIESKPRLIVLAHPRCPCTGATIDELTELMQRSRGNLQAQVYFYFPSSQMPSWAQSPLWKRAALVPGVEVFADSDGLQARGLGAKTSGQALLFGADGRLLFSGGLTDSRGHSGESAGRQAVLSLISHPNRERVSTPVFGCPILRTSTGGEGDPLP